MLLRSGWSQTRQHHIPLLVMPWSGPTIVWSVGGQESSVDLLTFMPFDGTPDWLERQCGSGGNYIIVVNLSEWPGPGLGTKHFCQLEMTRIVPIYFAWIWCKESQDTNTTCFPQGLVCFCSPLLRASRSAFSLTASSEASPPPEALLDCGQFCQVSSKGVKSCLVGGGGLDNRLHVQGSFHYLKKEGQLCNTYLGE